MFKWGSVNSGFSTAPFDSKCLFTVWEVLKRITTTKTAATSSLGGTIKLYNFLLPSEWNDWPINFFGFYRCCHGPLKESTAFICQRFDLRNQELKGKHTQNLEVRADDGDSRQFFFCAEPGTGPKSSWVPKGVYWPLNRNDLWVSSLSLLTLVALVNRWSW